MRHGVIKIDRFADPLPRPDKGSFCNRPQTIPDDKSVDPPVKTQNVDQPFIKRNASLSHLTLWSTENGLVVAESNRLLHKDQSSLPINILPAKSQHLTPPHFRIKE